jgi:hypothetical protein
MTTQDRDFEELIRSALRAAAESIEPSGGGLERIRHRLDSRRSVHSVAASFADWVMLLRIRLSVRLEPVTDTGRPALGRMARPARPAGRSAGRQHARPWLPLGRLEAARPWLRPALAVSAVVAVVMVGFVTLHSVQQTIISPTNSVTAPGSRPGGGRPDTVFSPLGVNPSQYPAGSGRQAPGAGVLPAATCSPTPKVHQSKPKPTASGTGPAATPTPSDSAPATPTPSGFPSAGPQPTPTDTSGTGGTTASTTAFLLVPATASGCGGSASPAASARPSPSAPGA